MDRRTAGITSLATRPLSGSPNASLRMSNSRARLPLLVFAVASLAACDAITSGVSGNPVGVGNLSARTKGTGFTTAPNIAFYRVTGATFVTTSGISDTCVAASYSEATASTPTPVNAPGVSAGQFLTISIGGRTDTLRQTAGSTDISYRSSIASGIPFTPGDSMVITVAGNQDGFPVSTFRGKTAEAFVLNPIVVPAAGNPIAATWTPATDTRAGMFLTFRYATGSATTFNRQIACSFVDDGAGTVPAIVAGDWIAATQRDVIAQRIRTIYTQVNVPLSYFNLVSSYHWPTPTSP
jgi:hypothetical protein